MFCVTVTVCVVQFPRLWQRIGAKFTPPSPSTEVSTPRAFAGYFWGGRGGGEGIGVEASFSWNLHDGTVTGISWFMLWRLRLGE